jgi:hypothetical protein
MILRLNSLIFLMYQLQRWHKLLLAHLARDCSLPLAPTLNRFQWSLATAQTCVAISHQTPQAFAG